MAQEDQHTIAAWAAKTFGPAPSFQRVAARANEEMAELLRVVTSTSDVDAIMEEAADVVIVLNRLATLCGRELDAAIDRKMAINRERVWKRDGTGHGYHVREERA